MADNLHTGEQRFRLLADSAPVLMWLADSTGAGVWFNRSWLAFAGQSAEDELGLGWAASVHPQDRERCLAARQQHFGTRTAFTLEYRLRRYDGVFRWMLDSGVPLFEGPGATFSGFVGSCVDITDRKQAELMLRESDLRLRSAMSIDTVGVLFFGLEGRILDCNGAFERMSGYTREELKGMTHWCKLTAPEFVPVTLQAAHDLTVRGSTLPYEKQLIRRDSSRWWGLFAPTRLEGSEHSAECVEFIIDISQAKSYEQALRDADRRKDQFLATLAHELRNPLAPLKSGLEIARLTSGVDSPVQRTLAMMERQLDHLVHLVNDLLDVARVSSGKIVLRTALLRVADVLTQSLEASRPAIERREQQLLIECAAEDLWIRGDFDRLAQVFSNLLSNASKYTHSRGRITLRAGRDGDDVLIEVIDTGEGIERENLDRVFDLFSQVRRQRGDTAAGGLGIGLALVKDLVALHGGAVTAHSAGLGQGSRFSVRLPASEPALAPAAIPDTPELSSIRYRILVADDNIDAAGSLAQLLRLDGHEVEITYDGLQAVESARRFRPHVIFLDIGMPHVDGIEAARRIREMSQSPRARLIALTGWGQAADRFRTRAAGFDAHLVKPVDSAALRRVLAPVS
jgi:PAS domain S-box-containing protein